MLKEQFLNKLQLKHPNNLIKYDYSLIPNQFKSGTKIPIICKTHGIFEQNSSNHLFGSGCTKCSSVKISISKSSNTEEFIRRCKSIHGDKYSYNKVDYKYSLEKVIITCSEHGDFQQRAASHLRGIGCPNCSYIKKKPEIELIQNRTDNLIKELSTQIDEICNNLKNIKLKLKVLKTLKDINKNE